MPKQPEFSLEDAKESLQINRNRLDSMCSEHPQSFFNVSEALAKAIDLRDTLKDELGKVSARLSKDIRQEFVLNGEKITEVRLEQEVLLRREYTSSFEDYMEAKLNADYWQGMRDSFMQRGRMLQEVCQLHLAGYFSEIAVKTPEIEKVSYDGARKRINMERQKKR